MSQRTMLTKSAVDKLAVPGPQEVSSAGYLSVYDEAITGFHLRLYPAGPRHPNGVKTYVYGYRNAAGKPRAVTIGRHGRFTPDQARKAAQQLAARVALGEDPAEDKKEAAKAGTVGDLMDAYLARHIKVEAERGTIRSVERSIVWIKKMWGTKGVTDFEDTHVNAKLNQIPKGARNNATAYLSAAWRWGRRNGVIPKTLANPCEGIKKVPSVSRAQDVTDEEYARIGAVIDEMLQDNKNDPSRLLAIKFMALYGCRPVEAMRLKPSDEKRDRGVITLAEHKTARKTGKVKVFLITPLAAEILDQAAALRKNDEYLFPRRWEQYEHNWYASAWRSIRERAKVEHLSLTNFRSAFITVAHDELGLTLDHVAGMTQHADTRTVKNNYLITRGSSVRSNLVAMHELLDAKMRGRALPPPDPDNVVPLREAS